MAHLVLVLNRYLTIINVGKKKLEEQPVLFSTEILYEQLSKSRFALGNFVGFDDQDLIFFQNPTTAVSNIIFSPTSNETLFEVFLTTFNKHFILFF